MDSTARRGDIPNAAADSHRSRRWKPEANVQPYLQFVNHKPQSEVERRKVRVLVRANATKFRWRQTKKAYLHSSNNRTTPASRSRQPIRLLELKSNEYDDEGVDADQVSHDAIAPSSRRPAAARRVSTPLPVGTSSPLNLTRIGNISFESYPSKLPKEILRFMVPQGW